MSNERPEGGPQNSENPGTRYLSLLGVYIQTTQQVRELMRRVASNPRLQERMEEVDSKRHTTHLELIEVGRQLGKKKEDVLVDIVRRENTLDEYGLPEFSILAEGDIIDTGDWHNPYDFNVDPDERRPGDRSTTDWVKTRGESVIKPNEVMLVFAITPIENYGDDTLYSPDYPERKRRAEALAREIQGRIFDARDSGYHEAYARILGVIFPKGDLERVVGIVRGNPKRFRLGEEFYAESKIALLEKINAALKNIGSDKIRDIPWGIQGTEILRYIKIVMVDDDEGVLEKFIPPIVVATNGKAVFIPDGGQGIEALVQEITASEADVVLLDYHLALGLDGSDVARALLSHPDFRGSVVGFSSDQSADQVFKNAHVLGAVDKNPDEPEESLIKLAEVLSALR